jgi:PLP dependent protein
MTTYKELITSLDKNNVTLVAVSKTKPVRQIMDIYNQGHRIFGENRVQELVEKYPALPENIEWHMIGHLQSNKVKHIAHFVSMIHAVDSLKLLHMIDKQGIQHNRRIDALLQLKIAKEESKFGFSFEDLKSQLRSIDIELMTGVRIRGVMGMASFVDDTDQIRSEFRTLKACYDSLKKSFFSGSDFDTISMGMSGDYEVAIEEGSTMVRIGSLIFGPRN